MNQFRGRPWLVVGLVVTLVGCSKEATPPATEEGQPAPVRAVPGERLALAEWTELLGTTQPLPDRLAKISAAVEGRVVSVLGDGKTPIVEGTRIASGQAVVMLDDRIARSNLAKVKGQLAELTEQVRQAQLAIDLAEIEVRRLTELAKNQGASLPLVSRIELEKAQLSRKDTESKQRALDARKTSLEAERDAVATQLDFMTIRSPIAGRLGLIQVAPGQTIAAGTVVAEVTDLDEIDVLCFVPPHAAARLAEGQPARLAGVSGKEHGPTGKVVYIGVQAQAETGTYPVKVRFPNKDLHLRGNAVVSVEVQTQKEAERFVIPEVALLEDVSPAYVMAAVKVKNDKKGDHEGRYGEAQKLVATVGVRDRGRHVVEIRELVDAEKGERVDPARVLFVVEGAHGLHNGDVLKVEENQPEKK
jgi:RND family efflux transporter MFP subunit